MRATEIMGMIGDDALNFLSSTTKADYKVHKLKGSVLFKLLVYSLLTNRQISLRVPETVFDSYHFKAASAIPLHEHTRYNSIRDRIATIPSLYFKKLFEHTVATYSKVLGSDCKRLIRYDSHQCCLT